MKLTFLGTSSENGQCPTFYATDRGTYVVQGWKITDAEALAKLDMPAQGDRARDPRRPAALRPARHRLMALLLGEDFNQLFGSFERSARRLETRDRYDVPSERPYLDRWRAGMQEDPEHLA